MPVGQSRPEMTFTTKGFRDWKHATGKNGTLASHDSCLAHKQAMIAWNQYKVYTQMGTTLSEPINSSKAKTIEKTRHYLKTLVEILLL